MPSEALSLSSRRDFLRTVTVGTALAVLLGGGVEHVEEKGFPLQFELNRRQFTSYLSRCERAGISEIRNRRWLRSSSGTRAESNPEAPTFGGCSRQLTKVVRMPRVATTSLSV